MTSNNNRNRYLIVIALSIVMNAGLGELATLLQLPFWLDTTGTVFAAITLEPTAGLLVGLVNNFVGAIMRNSPSSLIFYALSACAAIIPGVVMRKKGWSLVKRIGVTIALGIVLQDILSILLNFWQGGGVLIHVWEQNFCNAFMAMGLNWTAAAAIGIGLVKGIDVAVTLLLVGGLYKLLPKKLYTPLDAPLN